MANFLFAIFRDLYVVLLLILAIEQIPGSDLLHDVTRKGIITVTIIIVVAKLVQPLVDGSTAGPGRSPCRQKKTESGTDDKLQWASVEMQGWRPAMEDASRIVASLPAPLSNQAFFAVFDGHGGAQVSRIASKEFPKVLAACVADENGSSNDANGEDKVPQTGDGQKGGDAKGIISEKCKEGENGLRSAGSPDLAAALRLSMLTMDSVLRKGGSGMASRMSPAEAAGLVEETATRNAFNLMGSTAIVVLVERSDCGATPAADGGGDDGQQPRPTDVGGQGRPRHITVANCGDSRAVLCRKGKAVELSEDHKPELKREEERIRNAGGHVAMVGPCHRIDGWGLNLSRALGDFHYKARKDLPPEQQKVSAVPDIEELELTADDEFLLLGCDGIFELHTSQQAVDIVRAGFEAGLSVEKAAEDLVDKSCSSNLMKTRGKGGDNCSAIVVKFLK